MKSTIGLGILEESSIRTKTATINVDELFWTSRVMYKVPAEDPSIPLRYVWFKLEKNFLLVCATNRKILVLDKVSLLEESEFKNIFYMRDQSLLYLMDCVNEKGIEELNFKIDLKKQILYFFTENFSIHVNIELFKTFFNLFDFFEKVKEKSINQTEIENKEIKAALLGGIQFPKLIFNKIEFVFSRKELVKVFDSFVAEKTLSVSYSDSQQPVIFSAKNRSVVVATCKI